MKSTDAPQKIKEELSKLQSTLGLWEFNPEVAVQMSEILKSCMPGYLNSSYDYLNYGPSLGVPIYLETLAKFLSQQYQDHVKSSNLMATYSASYGWMLLVDHFLEKNDYVFFEDLSFPKAIDGGKNFGLKIEVVSTDEHGIILPDLENRLKECQPKSTHEITEEKPYWAIVFLMTVGHNPRGINYSKERCEGVIKLARKYNVLIVTDDVYVFFQYNLQDGEKPGNRLISYDNPEDSDYGIGHVISNGSLSKVIFPSLRMGWLEGSQWQIKQISSRPDVECGGGYNSFNQGITAALMNSTEFPIFFESIKGKYKLLLQTTCKYLEDNLPENVTFKKPKGGFVLWLEMPPSYKVSDLNKRLEKYGLSVEPGPKYSALKEFENCFRLCFTNFPKDILLVSLELLCKEIKDMMN